MRVSTHSRPKAAGITLITGVPGSGVSTHSRPKAAGKLFGLLSETLPVSTHSRPKAAGYAAATAAIPITKFQHTAARRRLGRNVCQVDKLTCVSTHSRPKAAGKKLLQAVRLRFVSTHSRPKAAGSPERLPWGIFVRFNTQPPEGGWNSGAKPTTDFSLFQHTAARRRLGDVRHVAGGQEMFQHTAARRRLVFRIPDLKQQFPFQHTAARRRLGFASQKRLCVSSGFNTQPPEGGWLKRSR